IDVRPADHVNGGDMKTGAIAEMTEALCLAELASPGHGYAAMAQATLDDLAPGGANTLGLLDTSPAGGWYQGVLLGGSSAQSPTSVSLNNAYKEVGRMATMMRAFIACDRALPGRYAGALASTEKAIVAAYYADGHGWPYQENNDYSLYKSSGITQNW